MRARRLEPAFVITFATLLSGCNERPPPDRPVRMTNPPEPTATSTGNTVATTEATASTPPATPRRRTVRNPLPQNKYVEGPIDWAKARQLNPSDASGRRIFSAGDGSCYVKLPPDPGTPIGPPGMDMSKPLSVDCPDVMQDPAWDTCFGETLTALPNGTCICPHTGNPPPPPSLAECPKTKP